MATIPGFDLASFNEWVLTRPLKIQKLCKRIPADRLYFMENSGHRVTIYSYNEDGTLTVEVLGKYNHVVFERRVFGIKPSDLTECDFPPPDEKLGAILTKQEDIDDYCADVRKTNGLLGRN